MKSSTTFRWHRSIKEIPREKWAHLVNKKVLPFYDWNWLNALEESESVSSRYGWQPLHLSLWENNRLISLAPLYLKNHSYGEFIFDQAFANLSNRLSVPYYPKLIGMSPFSPIEGYKFFIRKGEDIPTLTNQIMNLIDNFARENKIHNLIG